VSEHVLDLLAVLVREPLHFQPLAPGLTLLSARAAALVTRLDVLCAALNFLRFLVIRAVASAESSSAPPSPPPPLLAATNARRVQLRQLLRDETSGEVAHARAELRAALDKAPLEAQPQLHALALRAEVAAGLVARVLELLGAGESASERRDPGVGK
jgi:hypothetical protein